MIHFRVAINIYKPDAYEDVHYVSQESTHRGEAVNTVLKKYKKSTLGYLNYIAVTRINELPMEPIIDSAPVGAEPTHPSP